ncbi:TIGR03757 family integrating conjugative element protein [Proteus mirabilis]|uniref:TIGR03757 family integrating conjugative element protein n=1 Tax=Proteus mirabilis TaxID=584 RepID=UPI00368132F1
MKKRCLSLSGALMLSLMSFPLNAGTVLYTTHNEALPQTGIPFEVVYLDTPERLLDETLLQQGGELSEANAMQIIAFLQSPLWQAKEQALHRAYQGIVQAWRLGVERLPAVVVDEQWVVYGTTDIEQAVGQIQQYREQQEAGGQS